LNSRESFWPSNSLAGSRLRPLGHPSDFPFSDALCVESLKSVDSDTACRSADNFSVGIAIPSPHEIEGEGRCVRTAPDESRSWMGCDTHNVTGFSRRDPRPKLSKMVR
jgi:hypothetical protein